MAHAEFLKAIENSPRDPEPCLVFADWLEEQSDERTVFARLRATACRIRNSVSRSFYPVARTLTAVPVKDYADIVEWGQRFEDVAGHMFDQFGDGRLTAQLLTAEFVMAGCDASLRGEPIDEFLRDLSSACESVSKHIREQTVWLNSPVGVMRACMTAGHGNERLAQVIVEALQVAGRDGVLSVERMPENSTSEDVRYRAEEDLRFPFGEWAPEHNGRSFLLTAVPVLVFADPVDRAMVQVAAESIHEDTAVLVAPSFQDNAVVETDRNPEFIPVSVEKTEGWRDLLEDLALAAGGMVVSDGRAVEQSGGRACLSFEEGLVVRPVRYRDDAEAYQLRLRRLVESDLPDGVRSWHQVRLARLFDRIVHIEVSAQDSNAADLLELLCIQAMHATRSAIAYGTVRGAGCALAAAAQFVPEADRATDRHREDIRNAFLSPLTALCDNTSMTDEQKREILELVRDKDSRQSLHIDLADLKTDRVRPKFVEDRDNGPLDSTNIVTGAVDEAFKASLSLLSGCGSTVG